MWHRGLCRGWSSTVVQPWELPPSVTTVHGSPFSLVRSCLFHASNGGRCAWKISTMRLCTSVHHVEHSRGAAVFQEADERRCGTCGLEVCLRILSLKVHDAVNYQRAAAFPQYFASNKVRWKYLTHPDPFQVSFQLIGGSPRSTRTCLSRGSDALTARTARISSSACGVSQTGWA
jgi:hypothetical protein